jgi:GT2 family glycosyltransferase
VSTASCGLWADVFHELGGFRDDFPTGEDKDFAWRAHLRGRRVAAAPGALVAYRYRPTVHQSVRQHFGYGRGNPRLYRHFRRAGMTRTETKEVLSAWLWVLFTAPALTWSREHRGRWAVRAGKLAGQVVGSIRERVLFP